MNSSSTSARDLFLHACAIDAHEDRTRFLEQACSEEPGLREEVEALLREQDELGDFLEAPAMKSDHSEGSSHMTTVTIATERGGAIGPYKLLQEIGEGGCGVVYLAEQEVPVRRRVALKVIKLGMDTKSVIARFESERQALAMMDHPNIARVLDAGTTERGRPYFVMELVRGIRITDYADEHKLTLEQRLKLFIQVSQAIQHAHQKGIIHRDIKPSNILVTLNDGAPIPKIIDFGIAKATEQRLTDKTLFTEVQSFMGTPAYMSPEQAEMRGLDIDTRSDIYALGVLLYELLVGKTPFDAAVLREQGLDACRKTIREVDPARPSQRVLAMESGERTLTAGVRGLEPSRLAHALRGDLDWIVMKCLEKDRQRRYDTASALAEDVQHFLAGDLVTARPPSTLYRWRKTVKRHRVAVTAASLVALILVVAASLSIWHALRATRAEKSASLARVEQERLREEAEGDRELAEASADRARMNEYVAEMNLAYQALRDGNLGRAFQLVDKHGAAPESTALRGFEWRYLRELCEGDEHLSFPNQNTAVHELKYSPDGDILAVVGRDEVLLWDVASRTRLIQLPVAARALAFSPDGRTLYTAGSEGVRVWNTATWTPAAGPAERARSLDLTPDGRRLLIGTGEHVTLYDTGSWERLWILSDARAPAVFSPDGTLFASESPAGLQVRDSFGAEPGATLEDSRRLFFFSNSIVFTRDNRHLIAPRNVSSAKGSFVLGMWDVATGKEAGTLPADTREFVSHTGNIVSLSLSPDGRTLATASMDHSVGLWDVETRGAIAFFRGHRHEVWGLSFSPLGDRIAAGGKDGSLFLWPSQAPVRDDVIEGQGDALALSPDGTRMASLLREDATLRILDLGTRAIVRSLPLAPSPGPSEVAVSRDFTAAVQATSEGSFFLWDLNSGQSRPLDLPEMRAHKMTLSPNGNQWIARHRSGRASWWRLQDATGAAPVLVRELEGVSAVQFSHDGGTLVTMHEENDVRVWNADSADERSRFTARAGGQGLALSPDGSILATTASWTDSENSIWLWSTGTGELQGELYGHKQSIAALEFSADGDTLASASYDSSLKFWHLATGQELLSIRRVGTTLRELIFSPDGQWLAANAGGPFSLEEEIHLFHAPREG